MSPTVEESVLRSGPADRTPSDAFPDTEYVASLAMVHCSNPASPAGVGQRRAKCAWKRHGVTFPAEGISRRGVADGRRVRASLRARGSHAFRCVSEYGVRRVARDGPLQQAASPAWVTSVPSSYILEATRPPSPGYGGADLKVGTTYELRPDGNSKPRQGWFGEPCERRDVLRGRQPHR